MALEALDGDPAWLAEIFPEAVLNLRPGDKLKRPLQIDSGSECVCFVRVDLAPSDRRRGPRPGVVK